MSKLEIPKIQDDFEDPLAVRVGTWAEDIPDEGWPIDFKPEVIGRLLNLMPTED